MELWWNQLVRLHSSEDKWVTVVECEWNQWTSLSSHQPSLQLEQAIKAMLHQVVQSPEKLSRKETMDSVRRSHSQTTNRVYNYIIIFSFINY